MTNPCDELDDDHPLWLVNAQIDGLLEGLGASEDHENVLKFLRGTGLPEGMVARVHRAIVNAEREDREERAAREEAWSPPAVTPPAPKLLPIIATFRGIEFNLVAPAPVMVNVVDVAHALSNICRFTGHCQEFYSVAQHCVLASFHGPEDEALARLVHDAVEAYFGDVSSPLKQLLPEYKRLERHAESVVLPALGVALPLPPSVKPADLTMLATEKRDLMRYTPMRWSLLDGIKPGGMIAPWSPRFAREAFLTRYVDLTARERELKRQPTELLKAMDRQWLAASLFLKPIVIEP